MSEENKVYTEETSKKKGKKDKPKKSIGQEIVEWILTILAALVIAFAIRSLIFEPVKVDGASMNDTLVDGEIMLVTKFEYSTADIPFVGKVKIGGEPKRFDVIICHYPDRTSPGLLGIVSETNFVKRVVGLPGDTIKLENGYLYIKAAGETEYTRYDEPYVSAAYRDGGLNTSLASAMRYSGVPNPYTLNEDGSYTVPEGSYFVMGDHRNNSNDSRCIGPITRDQIVGKVAQVVWPLSGFRGVPNGLDVK